MSVLRIKGAPGEDAARKEIFFPLGLGITSAAGHAQAAQRALGHLIPECAATSGTAPIREINEPGFDSEEYRLRIKEGAIEIFCSRYAGFVRALSSLSLLAKVSGDKIALPECDFTDAPAIPTGIRIGDIII
ncbi:MAG: hypothetical protein IJV00_06210 [Clostridia bacterium]|nr:hypothetical protein [Clostridia bacterium]